VSKLPYVYWCNHLTEVGCQWRGVDYDSRVVVRGLKQEDFNGFLQLKIGGQIRRFDKDNVEDFIKIMMPIIGRELAKDTGGGPISIVPIPNSGMAVNYNGPFRSVELASMVASGYGASATVCPAVRWDSPRAKAHQSNDYRHPDLYEPHMVLIEEPKSPIVLFDDVLTSGSQMIAAARMLGKKGFPPVRAVVVAKATKAQDFDQVFTRHEGALELANDPFDFDF
jgi:hypothetical protein